MAYRLKTGEKLSNGIERIALEQIDSAIAQLTGNTNDSQDEAIHSARKSFKKIRALLRLVRDSLGQQTYKQENACFRDAGRLLSDIRDAQVYVETLDKLTQYFSDYISPHAFDDIRSSLVEHCKSAYHHTLDESDAVETAINKIKAARERVESWSIGPNDWSTLEPSLQRIYKQGYRTFPLAYEQPTMENFHEWRKRVKDLWYSLRILEPLWPDMMSEMAEQVNILGGYLGDDHDFAVLRQLLAEQPKLASKRAELEAVLGLIERRQPQLQSDAKILGQRIYAEKPQDFVKRIGAYWQIWQTQGKK